MYLHLGNDLIIKQNKIIGIYDMDKATVSKRTREYLEYMEKSGRLIYASNELPKSFIVYGEGNDITVYVSQISNTTLLKRCDFIEGEYNV